VSQKTKIATTIFCVLGIILFSFYRWLDHPLPQYEGKKRLPNLKNTVDVYTDPFGVPHVFSQNEDDLFFTAG
jgi:penicillin amidase